MTQPLNFALIGAAGYIAPRHIKAIADTGNNLMVAYDKFDSVGRLDSSFPDCSFFTENEQFDRFCSKQMRTQQPLHWLSICTPNYTHDAFIRYGLRLGVNVICEKPLVLNPYNIDNLVELEQETGHQAYTILQLRLHEAIVNLKKKVEQAPKDKIFDVDLTYITSRGKWYYSSWKGDVHKSGGVATNIGVHFYDMLQWVFGPVRNSVVHIMSFDRVAGYLELERARVRYFLSINAECLPPNAVEGEKKTFRLLSIDGEEFEFSSGFTELHTESYRRILRGTGFRISEARPCIELVSNIRHSEPIGLRGDYHPLARLPLAPHPFGWDEKR
ncbi:MAG: Gfo/Idh/MocA family oxidoreductase [Paludibacteraceae bacterium]|nr:Gfo/Idh/MocA family oxidoreductase [Paludibacteraceae bacterium]